MPPVIFPCGGTNQPSCPPTNASATNGPILVPAVEIVRAYAALSIEERAEAYAALAKEPK